MMMCSVPLGATAQSHLSARAWMHSVQMHVSGMCNTQHTEDEKLVVGSQFQRTKTYTITEVMQFLDITGDKNPVHRSQEVAVAAGFSGPILPGAMMTALFPAIIGSTFPGAIYASQSVTYRSPALVGQPVVAQVTVLKRSRDWVVFHTCCKGTDGRLLVEGEAKSKIRTTPPS